MRHGIELRISLDGHTLVETDSASLHFIATYAGADRQGWYPLLRTAGVIRHASTGAGPIHIGEKQPAQLAVDIRAVNLDEPRHRGPHRGRRFFLARARRTRSDSAVYAWTPE